MCACSTNEIKFRSSSRTILARGTRSRVPRCIPSGARRGSVGRPTSSAMQPFRRLTTRQGTGPRHPPVRAFEPRHPDPFRATKGAVRAPCGTHRTGRSCLRSPCTPIDQGAFLPPGPQTNRAPIGRRQRVAAGPRPRASLETVCEAIRGHEAHNRSRLCRGCEGQGVCQADFAMAVSESRSRAVATSATASSISSSRVENPKLNRIDASASSPDIPMARST